MTTGIRCFMNIVQQVAGATHPAQAGKLFRVCGVETWCVSAAAVFQCRSTHTRDAACSPFVSHSKDKQCIITFILESPTSLHQ